jgi:phenylpyruvate tautomerase PptA (4-oxalocrotonate tautomerase family)
MPLTHITLRAGKPEAYRQAIFDSLHQAMQATFNVPKDNHFATMAECDAAHFRYNASYLGVARSDDLVIIQITANNTRSEAQKKALYRQIVERLGHSPGVRPEDVFISLIEVDRANWSLGHGEAQYA